VHNQHNSSKCLTLYITKEHASIRIAWASEYSFSLIVLACKKDDSVDGTYKEALKSLVIGVSQYGKSHTDSIVTESGWLVVAR